MSFSLYDAIAYIMLTLPRRLYQMFSNAALIGGLLGLGGLAATGELTALRAAGMSGKCRRRGGSVGVEYKRDQLNQSSGCFSAIALQVIPRWHRIVIEIEDPRIEHRIDRLHR